MTGPHRGQRLLVALLVVGVSSGLSTRLSRPAHALAAPAGRDGRAPVLQQATRRPGLALTLHRALAGAAAASLPPLGASGALTWTQQAELTSTAEMPNDAFAQVVALSGNTAVAGAPFTPPSSADGAAYVFARSGGVWTQQVELTNPGGLTDTSFGTAVAVSGTTLAVGAPGADGGLGAVYVYTRSGSAWTVQAALSPADVTQPENFATALALSGDTLVVGADGQHGGNGAVYLFGRSGGVWRQQAEFRDPGGLTFAEFGWAVALSGDTVVVGAPQAPLAYVYARSGGVWAFQGVLQAPHAPSLYYGLTVALSGDTALVGACNVLGRQSGAVYVFGRSGSAWSLQATIPPPPGSDGDLFGQAVALDGPTALIGGIGVFAYVGQGSTWVEQAQLVPSNLPPYDLGGTAAVAGRTALVGATGSMGAAYVFVRHRVGDTASTDDSDMALRPTPRGRVR